MAREKKKKVDGLTKTILSTAKSLHKHGIMDKATYEKITLRHLGGAVRATAKALTGREIRELRNKENISQAVLAHYLHVTVGYVSQLERDEKRPTGPTLVLLNVIRRKGLEAIL
jgi:putative transcriptional regulator